MEILIYIYIWEIPIYLYLYGDLKIRSWIKFRLWIKQIFIDVIVELIYT